MAACQRGLRVRYTTAVALVNELVEASTSTCSPRLVARYGRLDLLCLASRRWWFERAARDMVVVVSSYVGAMGGTVNTSRSSPTARP